MSKKQFSKQMKLHNIMYDNYDLIFSDKSRLVKYNKKLEDGLILHRHYKKKDFEYEVATILEILNAFMDEGVKYNEFIKDKTILLNFQKSIDNLSYIDKYNDYFNISDEDELEYDNYYYTTDYKVLSEDEEEEKDPLRALFHEIRNFSYFNLNSLNLYDFNLYKDKTPIFTLDTNITREHKTYVFKGNNNVVIRAWKHKDGKQNDLIIRYFCALDKENRDKPMFKGEGYKTLCLFVNRIFNNESDLTEQSKVSLQTGDIIPCGDNRIKFNQKQLTNYYKSKGFIEEGFGWLSKPITKF